MENELAKKSGGEITPTNASSIIKSPGDKIEQYMTPKGDVITKANTAETNFTHRQYCKSDGTPGKQTITFKQIDEKK